MPVRGVLEVLAQILELPLRDGDLRLEHDVRRLLAIRKEPPPALLEQVVDLDPGGRLVCHAGDSIGAARKNSGVTET